MVWPVFGAVEGVPGGTADVGPDDGPTVLDEGADESSPVGLGEDEGIEDEGTGVRSAGLSLSEQAPTKAAAIPRPTTHLVRTIVGRP